MKEKIKNIINSVPNSCWYFFVLIAVILIMDIKNGPLEIQKYLIIEDIQQASYDSQKNKDFSLEYYQDRNAFLSAMNKDLDVTNSYFNYMYKKSDDPAKNRRYAKLTVYYDVSTNHTIEHNIWFRIRTENNKPVSVFEVLLSRIDTGGMFSSYSIDGRTYVYTKGNYGLNILANFTVYPPSSQIIKGSDDVYYESNIIENIKNRFPLQYRNDYGDRYYLQHHEIIFLEMQ